MAACGDERKAKDPPGNDLLSQGLAPQVPSALAGLTAWFGMEQGVSPPLQSPRGSFIVCFRSLGTLRTEQNARTLFQCITLSIKPSAISTASLNALLRLHVPPI
jgi:hypothetical protein